jgi:hypothetical protein
MKYDMTMQMRRDADECREVSNISSRFKLLHKSVLQKHTRASVVTLVSVAPA